MAAISEYRVVNFCARNIFPALLYRNQSIDAIYCVEVGADQFIGVQTKLMNRLIHFDKLISIEMSLLL